MISKVDSEWKAQREKAHDLAHRLALAAAGLDVNAPDPSQGLRDHARQQVEKSSPLLAMLAGAARNN